MSLENTIRKLRIQSGKTQQEIAECLNIDRRTYAKWEEGITEIKANFIPKIAAAFNVSISDLYHGNKPMETKIHKALIIVTDGDAVEKILHLLRKSS
jgi:transcriptional regulator with XRE-family HTH domain